MQNLTGAFPAPLVPSSMSGGNTVADDPGLSMTAPGSPGIMPMPDVMDHLPLPTPSGPQVPVSHPGRRERVTPQPSRTGSHGWSHVADDVPAAKRWTETP